MKKNILKRGISAFLVLLFCFAALVSCGNNLGEPMLKLGSAELSVNVYELLLSRMKGALGSLYGTSVYADSYWDTTIDLDGTTYNDKWTAEVLDNAKNYVVALHLFDKYGLTLPEAMITEVDEKMDELLQTDGDGSKSELNNILMKYGVNYDILREFYITEQKMEYLELYLYGTNGSKIAAPVKEQYMQENYACFKQIYLASYAFVYEEDAYGNVIYYDEDGETYLYDTENGVTKTDESGKIIVDKNGDEIYFDPNGDDSAILYDKEKGKRIPVQDSEGNYKREDYTEEELEKIRSQIELFASQLDDGDFEDFEEIRQEFSEDTGMDEYEDGYILKVTDTLYGYEYLTSISEALAEMEIGEIRLIESDQGFHLIMKYECPEGAYADSDQSVWFEDFYTYLINDLFQKELDTYKKDVTVDEALFATVDMKSVASGNYNY